MADAKPNNTVTNQNQQPNSQGNQVNPNPTTPGQNPQEKTQVVEQISPNTEAENKTSTNGTTQTLGETQNNNEPKSGGKGFKEKSNNALHNTEGCMNEVLNATDEKVGKPVVGFTEKIGHSFKKWFKL